MTKKYADGLWSNPRKENQPDFVLANVSFHAERFAKWILENKNEGGYVNFQILNGNKGVYLKYDNWKPKQATGETIKKTTEQVRIPLDADRIPDKTLDEISIDDLGGEVMVEDIPF